MSTRAVSLAGQLAALGFADTGRAERLLAGELRLDPAADAGLIAAIGAASDPDLALASLARLADRAGPDLIAALRADPGTSDRLLGVLGASAALGEHLARHPADWQVLAGQRGQLPPGAAELHEELAAAASSAGDRRASLRAAYHRRILHLAARDLTGAATFQQVAAELAELAAAAIGAALVIARADAGGAAGSCRLAVIGMG
jgi:glutamate-ammonia-ligase adenylyltransferase